MSTGGSSKRPLPGSASSPAPSKRKTTNKQCTLYTTCKNYVSTATPHSTSKNLCDSCIARYPCNFAQSATSKNHDSTCWTNSTYLHITLTMVGNNYHSPPFFSPLKESVSTQQNKHGVATNIVDRACTSIFTFSKYIFCNVAKQHYCHSLDKISTKSISVVRSIFQLLCPSDHHPTLEIRTCVFVPCQ